MYEFMKNSDTNINKKFDLDYYKNMTDFNLMKYKNLNYVLDCWSEFCKLGSYYINKNIISESLFINKPIIYETSNKIYFHILIPLELNHLKSIFTINTYTNTFVLEKKSVFDIIFYYGSSKDFEVNDKESYKMLTSFR